MKGGFLYNRPNEADFFFFLLVIERSQSWNFRYVTKSEDIQIPIGVSF
jgi:hypothetical protein